MKTITIIIITALSIGGLACGKESGDSAADKAAPDDQKAAPEPAAPTAPATKADETAPAEEPAADLSTAPEGGDVAPEAAAATEVPTAEDFEEKAAAEVDAKNLEAEVSRMEKEIGTATK